MAKFEFNDIALTDKADITKLDENFKKIEALAVVESALDSLNYDPAGSAAGVRASLDAHTANSANPHGVTKNQIGLGNADNTADSTKSVASAAKLTSARTIRTNLGSTAAASFDGSANITPGVTGTLAIGNGGTGAATASAALTALGGVSKTYVDDALAAFSAGIPSGCILMWNGSAEDIPSGWVLCDGNNNTPNLRDRFIVGAGSTYLPGATGGASTVTLGTAHLPAHTHSLTNVSTDSAGAHAHTVNAGNVSGSALYQGTPSIVPGSSAVTTSSSGDHTHTLSGTSGSTGSGTAHENRPPYYALCFIMKS